MAVRSGVGGFGSGFAQGFGLVSDYMNSQKKMKLAEQELESDRMYREGLIEDRKRQREIDAEQNQFLQGLRTTQAETAGVNAQAALTGAEARKMAAETDAKKYDEDGNLIETAAQRAARLRDEAAKRNLDADYDRDQKAARNNRNAATISDIMRLTSQGDDASLQEAQRILEARKGDLFDERSELNIRSVLNPDSEAYFGATEDLITRIAQGDVIEGRLSPEVLAAVGDTFGSNRSRYMGQTITAPTKNSQGQVTTPSNFPNAPDYMQGGKIIGSNVIDIQQTTDSAGNLSITMTAANEVKMPDGKTYMYFAPITPGRSTQQGQAPAPIPVQDGMNAMFGRNLMAQHIQSDPVFRSRAEEQLKIGQFGSVEKYETAVKNEVNEIASLLQGENVDASSSAADVLGDDYDINTQGKTVGQMLDDRRFIESEVRKTKLYGPSQISYVQRAQRLVADLQESVPNYVVPMKNVSRRSQGPNRSTGGKISDLIKDDATLTLQHLSHIDGFFDDGNITPANRTKLMAYLASNGLLKK